TRDTWTLQPGAKLRREGGRNSGAINVKETNLAGTGTTLGFERSTTVDRTGSSVQLSHDHLFDGWTAAALEHSSYNDGSSESLSPDTTRAGPFLRYEVIQDDFLPVMNRERIRRPEYFTMGLHSTVQLGRALGAFGSTDQPWLTSASFTRGFRLPAGQQLLTG